MKSTTHVTSPLPLENNYSFEVIIKRKILRKAKSEHQFANWLVKYNIWMKQNPNPKQKFYEEQRLSKSLGYIINKSD